MRKEFIMKVGKIGVVIIGLVPFNVYGECTPTPDCASIGYTETSCETKSVKCPFDTSKLFCVPCDSSFQYDCSGDYIAGGLGSTCNGKYANCECVTGATFESGNCICDSSCSIGSIVYADKTCSSCNIPNKTPVAIVVYKENGKKIITPVSYLYMYWASSNIDVVALDSLNTFDLALADMNGVTNSRLSRESFTNDNSTNNASWYCYNLEIEGFEDKNGQWYLPSFGEIYNYYYGNYTLISQGYATIGKTAITGWLWTSTEIANTNAWTFNCKQQTANNDSKRSEHYVSCFLAID